MTTINLNREFTNDGHTLTIPNSMHNVPPLIPPSVTTYYYRGETSLTSQYRDKYKK